MEPWIAYLRSFQVSILALFLLLQARQSFRIPFVHHSSITKLDFSVNNDLPVSSRTPQLLSFVEPTTNVTVVLIGSMHYNPRSIALTKSTIEAYAQENRLSAVLIESCPIRFNKTRLLLNTFSDDELQRLPPLEQLAKRWKRFLNDKVFENEMYAAEQMAKDYRVPVILGDQWINVTYQRIRNGFQETARDLFQQPLRGGLQRIIADFQRIIPVAFPELFINPGVATQEMRREEYIGPSDFLNPQLLLATPISLFRYPLSILFRAPLLLLPIIASIFISTLPDVFSSFDDLSAVSLPPLLTQFDTLPAAATVDQIVNVLGTVLATVIFPVLEVVFVSRVFLVEILHERNIILAENLLQQCQQIATSEDQRDTPPPRTTNLWSRLFLNQKDKISQSAIPQTNQGKVVIAVLGMAHCNGVKKLLTSQLVQPPTTPASIIFSSSSALSE